MKLFYLSANCTINQLDERNNEGHCLQKLMKISLVHPSTNDFEGGLEPFSSQRNWTWFSRWQDGHLLLRCLFKYILWRAGCVCRLASKLPCIDDPQSECFHSLWSALTSFPSLLNMLRLSIFPHDSSSSSVVMLIQGKGVNVKRINLCVLAHLEKLNRYLKLAGSFCLTSSSSWRIFCEPTYISQRKYKTKSFDADK